MYLTLLQCQNPATNNRLLRTSNKVVGKEALGFEAREEITQALSSADALCHLMFELVSVFA